MRSALFVSWPPPSGAGKGTEEEIVIEPDQDNAKPNIRLVDRLIRLAGDVAYRQMIWRYVIVGIGTTAVYFGCYFAVRSSLAMVPWIASAVAFGVAAFFQYIAHARFTFGRKAKDRSQLIRFIATIIIGFIASYGVTGVMVPALGWPEFAGLIGVAIVVPVLNFLMFSCWVFIGKSAAPGNAPGNPGNASGN